MVLLQASPRGFFTCVCLWAADFSHDGPELLGAQKRRPRSSTAQRWNTQHHCYKVTGAAQVWCGQGDTGRGKRGVGGDWSTEKGSPWSSQLVRAGILAKVQDPNSGQPNFKPTFSTTARLVVTQDPRREGRRLNQCPESSRPSCTKAHSRCWVNFSNRF